MDEFAYFSALMALLATLCALYSAYCAYESKKFSRKVQQLTMDVEVKLKAFECNKLCMKLDTALAERIENKSISGDDLQRLNEFIRQCQKFCSEIRERNDVPNESKLLIENRQLSEWIVNLRDKIDSGKQVS